jgi:hypothetical protein
MVQIEVHDPMSTAVTTQCSSESTLKVHQQAKE